MMSRGKVGAGPALLLQGRSFGRFHTAEKRICRLQGWTQVHQILPYVSAGGFAVLQTAFEHLKSSRHFQELAFLMVGVGHLGKRLKLDTSNIPRLHLAVHG